MYKRQEDILFVSSGTGLSSGYFKNFGKTNRLGLDISIKANKTNSKKGLKSSFINYSYLKATFQSAHTLPAANHPNGSNDIEAGDIIPGMPLHKINAKVKYGIKNNINILDGCVIGKKGFGFFPDKKSNYRYPQIGLVIINDNAEIGCGSTIDRGSMSNTIIGKNTYLDNQIHIAHNVKIGENTIIAGQVGIAGSSIIGNNVKIGGQAGISGHLKIGNNVEIGGGSGVIRDIPDNTKVMGYPAKNIREFLKENK